MTPSSVGQQFPSNDEQFACLEHFLEPPCEDVASLISSLTGIQLVSYFTSLFSSPLLVGPYKWSNLEDVRSGKGFLKLGMIKMGGWFTFRSFLPVGHSIGKSSHNQKSNYNGNGRTEASLPLEWSFIQIPRISLVVVIVPRGKVHGAVVVCVSVLFGRHVDCVQYWEQSHKFLPSSSTSNTFMDRGYDFQECHAVVMCHITWGGPSRFFGYLGTLRARIGVPLDLIRACDGHPSHGASARLATFDVGDKYHQMESSDVVKKFPGLSTGRHIDRQRQSPVVARVLVITWS